MRITILGSALLLGYVIRPEMWTEYPPVPLLIFAGLVAAWAGFSDGIDLGYALSKRKTRQKGDKAR